MVCDPSNQITIPKAAAIAGADVRSLLENPPRLDALKRLELLDTPPEESFDRLTRLSARLLDVPVAFISLVDAARDFYKSAFGFPEPLASTRQIEGRTLCHCTLREGKPLFISDTHADPRYRDVPTVNALGIRAYAGVPLVTQEGHFVGSFCAIDFRPRVWSEVDVEILTAMAHSTMREMTLRRAAVEAMEQSRIARAATRAREHVLAVVAHDLRTPLNFLKMGAQLVAENPAAPDNRDLLKRMQGSIESMNLLIEDLLEAARETEKRVQPKPIFAQSLVEDAVSVVQPLAERQSTRIAIAAQPNLPKVMVDYQRILRVFSNLIVNALKFSPAETRIEVTAERSDNRVRFCVVDHGPGIAAENLQQIFDRFWQGDSSDRRGAGLGLSIAQEIVRAHGGELSVASTLGKGATFSFDLPVA